MFKKFSPRGSVQIIFFILLFCLNSLFLAVFVWGIIDLLSNPPASGLVLDYIIVAIGIALYILGVIWSICALYGRIYLTKEEVIVKADKWAWGCNKMQCAINVKYADIESMYWAWLKNDPRTHSPYACIVPYPFLILVLSDGSEKRIELLCYSKKQCIDLIEGINWQAGKYGKELLSTTAEEFVNDFEKSFPLRLRRKK